MATTRHKSPKLYYIEALDHHIGIPDDWVDTTTGLPKTHCHLRCVGWLVEEDAKYIRLVPEMFDLPGEPYDFSGTKHWFCVLKSAITKKRRIHE